MSNAFFFKSKIIIIPRYAKIFYEKRYLKPDKILFIHFFQKHCNILLQKKAKD